MIAETNRKALDACHIGPGKSVQIEDSAVDLSFGGLAPFSIEAHFYIEPCSEPILPPGHQQGPAQWHGHQVLVSKFNGCVSGEYRLGLDAQRRVIFQREVDPWIVTTTDPIPSHEWHSVVATYDGETMRVYVDSRLSAQVACGAQKADTTTPVLLGADLCGYATAHHFEGYLSEVSIWARCLDVTDIRLLAQHGPTGHAALLDGLACYWCLYQRTETPNGAGRAAHSTALVHNGARAPGVVGLGAAAGSRFRGRVVSEGDWAIGRFKSWLYSGAESDHLDVDDGGLAAPPDDAPPWAGAEGGGGAGAADGGRTAADGGRTTGVLFSQAARSHMRICGSASSLSFGERRPYTLAAQIYPRPPPAAPAASGGRAHSGNAAGAGGEQVVLSKFNAGLRGEYRLGLDAHGRPFVGREAEPWAILAPTPLAPNRWHALAATYDGDVLRLFVDHVLVASAPSGAQFCDQVTPVLIGCDMERDSYAHHFEGFVAEVCIWERALSAAEVGALRDSPPDVGTPLYAGLLGCWRLLESKRLRLHAAGRVVVPNAAFDPAAADGLAARVDGGGHPPRLGGGKGGGGGVGAGSGGVGVGASGGVGGGGGGGGGGAMIRPNQPMHALLRTATHGHSLNVTMRPGVQALALELGAISHEMSKHWVSALSRLGTQSMRLRQQHAHAASSAGAHAARGAPAVGAGGGARAGGIGAALGGAFSRGARANGAGAAQPARAAGARGAGVGPGGGVGGGAYGGHGGHGGGLCQNGQLAAARDVERRYCYLGLSVALQKNLTQALDLNATEVLVHRLAREPKGDNDNDDLALPRLHAEYRQKLVDVRGRAWSLFKEWFFENPLHALRECDGDRCEFWRFKFPQRRVRACQVLVEQALARFPPRDHCPLVVGSFGSGLLFQDFCTTQMLLDAGFRHLRLCVVDSAYRAWKLKYLQRDSSCRVYVVPSAALEPALLRPDIVPRHHPDGDDAAANAALASCNNAISFVLSNDALHQFVQWFSCVPDCDVQVLLYDSVDAYITDVSMAPDEVACHICSAMDYKDNETLLEDAVNHMMAHTIAPGGIGVKLVTKPNEAVPGVYVVDQQLREIYHESLPPT